MKTVAQYLLEHGRQYPEPDLPNGCISDQAFASAGVPMIVSCANCTMTMACAAELPVDDDGRIYCGAEECMPPERNTQPSEA